MPEPDDPDRTGDGFFIESERGPHKRARPVVLLHIAGGRRHPLCSRKTCLLWRHLPGFRGEPRVTPCTEEITVADNHRGHHQDGQTEEERGLRFAAASLPLFECDAPQRAEDDDAGHMQCPAGEFEVSHLGLAHAVEEELQVPDTPCQRTEHVVTQNRDADRSPLSRLRYVLLFRRKMILSGSRGAWR